MSNTSYNKPRTKALSLLAELAQQQPKTGTANDYFVAIEDIAEQVITAFDVSQTQQYALQEVRPTPGSIAGQVSDLIATKWQLAMFVLGNAEFFASAPTIKAVTNQIAISCEETLHRFGLGSEAIAQGFTAVGHELQTSAQ